MPFDPNLAPGAILNNRQISEIFGCSIEGGIRKSNKKHCLVLIVNYTKPDHLDHWDGDILIFSGRGENPGTWQNSALAESGKDNVPLFLFELHEQGKYVYAGPVELAGAPHVGTRIASDGSEHKVLLFKLRKVA